MSGQEELIAHGGRPAAAVLEKFRLPIGSLVIDTALVLYLAFMGGQMTSRFEAMDTRLAAVETRVTAERLAERTALLEQRANAADLDRAEVLDYLRRIESKLDGKVDKQP